MTNLNDLKSKPFCNEQNIDAVIKKGNQTQINEAERVIKKIESLVGEGLSWELNTMLEGYINKPYLNKSYLTDMILNSGSPFYIFIYGIGVGGAPIKEVLQKLIEAGDPSYIYKFSAYAPANLPTAIEALKKIKAYKEIFFLLSNHPKVNKKIINNINKWFEDEAAKDDRVCGVSIWADCISDIGKKL